MKFLMILFIGLFCLTSTSQATSLRVSRRDMKLASQQLIEKQTILIPVVADPNRVLTTDAGPISAAAVEITTFTAQPDVPRNITITPTGTTTDVESCAIVVTGTNFFGASITDTITFSANASALVSGVKAFASVTSVAFPASCESGGFAATWIVGVGDVLGMKRCMDVAGHVMFATLDGSYEGTRPTCIADADEVEKNTCDINGTLDGAKDVELFFVQNFRCLP